MKPKTYRFKRDHPPERERSKPHNDDGYVAGVPLARVIPRVLDDRVENVMATAPRSLAAESFRRLANKLAKGTEESQVLVVTSSIPANTIAAGSPARVIKPLDDDRKIKTRAEWYANPAELFEEIDRIDREKLGDNTFLDWMRYSFFPRKGD